VTGSTIGALHQELCRQWGKATGQAKAFLEAAIHRTEELLQSEDSHPFTELSPRQLSELVGKDPGAMRSHLEEVRARHGELPAQLVFHRAMKAYLGGSR